MAKRKKFDASFDFGASASTKPKKSRFGMKRTKSGKVYFSGGGATVGGAKRRKSNRFSAAGGS